MLDSYEEHQIIAYALKRLVGCAPGADSFPARVKAVKAMVMAHVEEEEQELFPSVEEAIGPEENEALGKQLETRFKELVKVGYEHAVASRKARRTEDGHAERPGKATRSSKETKDTKKKMSHTPRRAA